MCYYLDVMSVNIYQELTQAFNAGRLRAILSSGQAVVMHRLDAWARIDAEIADMPLREAHATLVAHAEERLPFQVESAS